MIIIRGILGWANRLTETQLDAYGPGGRWYRNDHIDPKYRTGDFLGDALSRAGAHEGAILITVAIDRSPEATKRADELEAKIRELVREYEAALAES